MPWPSPHERSVWVARHPVWAAVFLAGFFFMWMWLVPSLREPRLLTTPLWVGLAAAAGVAFGVTMVTYLRHKYPPPPAGEQGLVGRD